MKPPYDNKGFTLIEIMAAMLLLSLAYVAILESFSSSLSQVSRLDRHYARLQEAEEANSIPLFSINEVDEIEGEIYLEGSKYQLTLIQSETSLVETLVLSAN